MNLIQPIIEQGYQQFSGYLMSSSDGTDTNSRLMALGTLLGVTALGLIAYSYSKRRREDNSLEELPERREISGQSVSDNSRGILQQSKKTQIQKEHKRSIDDDKEIDTSNLERLSETEIRSLCATYHVSYGESAQFRRFLKFHIQMWKGSERYREVVQAIETRKGEPVQIMDQDQAISALKLKRDGLANTIQNFKFEACWLEAINSVVLIKPETHQDHDIGSLIAFEMTNGYQQARFDEINKDARAGKYNDHTSSNDEIRLDRAATQYAYQMERVESDGRTIHDEMINQAISTKTITADWHWSAGKSDLSHIRVVECMIKTEFGQSHIEYYKSFYKVNIAPDVTRNHKNNLNERMKRLREAQSLCS